MGGVIFFKGGKGGKRWGTRYRERKTTSSRCHVSDCYGRDKSAIRVRWCQARTVKLVHTKRSFNHQRLTHRLFQLRTCLAMVRRDRAGTITGNRSARRAYTVPSLRRIKSAVLSTRSTSCLLMFGFTFHTNRGCSASVTTRQRTHRRLQCLSVPAEP